MAILAKISPLVMLLCVLGCTSHPPAPSLLAQSLEFRFPNTGRGRIDVTPLGNGQREVRAYCWGLSSRHNRGNCRAVEDWWESETHDICPVDLPPLPDTWQQTPPALRTP